MSLGWHRSHVGGQKLSFPSNNTVCEEWRFRGKGPPGQKIQMESYTSVQKRMKDCGERKIRHQLTHLTGDFKGPGGGPAS